MANLTRGGDSDYRVAACFKGREYRNVTKKDEFAVKVKNEKDEFAIKCDYKIDDFDTKEQNENDDFVKRWEVSMFQRKIYSKLLEWKQDR